MAVTFADYEIQKLNSLNTSDVQAVLQRLKDQLKELNPTLDLDRGVFHDLLLYHNAVIETALRQNLERYQSARSLQQIELDPSLADDAVVDEVLSNWGVTRKTGTKAIGSVTLELGVNRTVVVPIGFVFEANGLRFVARDTFTARTLPDQVITATDRLLAQLSNGRWAFTVDVEAEDVGEQYMLPAGTLVLPNRAIAGFVTGYSTTAFQDGTNTETNAELLQRLRYGISAKTLSNRSTMQAYITSLSDFSSITNQSIVGYGEPEMLRDKHSIVPIAYGGRVDWYIRTQGPLGRTTATIAATCTAINAASSTWQFSLSRSAYPGFYEVQKIRRATDSQLNTGFGIVSDSRSVDVTNLVIPPDIANVTEGAYTTYQTATIVFEDTVTPLGTITVGQTAEYVCDIVGMPLLAELQEVVSSSSYRHCAADILIRAPIPCFVDVSFVINKAATDAAPDTSAIKVAVADLVNQVDFIGRLDGSRIVETVHGFLQNASSVTQLELLGRIRYPDGGTEYIRAADSLLVPYRPQRLVSEKTVQFFTAPENIKVSVVTNLPTPA